MEMLVTARNALVNPSSLATWMLPLPIGRSTATSTTVMMQAVVMDKQADQRKLANRGSRGRGGYSQAMDIMLVYFNVLGKLQSQNTTRPTTAQTMVQVELSVRVFKQMVHVKMWLPMTKTWKMTWPQPKTSWNTWPIPKDLPMTSTASPKFMTNGYCFLNSPSMRPEYVERAPMMRIMMTPVVMPRVARTEGRERMPRETVSAIRTMAPCLFVHELVS